MTRNNPRNTLSAAESGILLQALENRFENNKNRHQGLAWYKVQARLLAAPGKLWSLHEMEKSGGEPDVGGHDKKSGLIFYYDFSPETPAGRRSLCYDREGLESRKEHRPANNALDMAAEMGIDLLTEDQYLALQELGNFDMKSSSWLFTPAAVRKLGGALFGDRRYGRVFVYHNGAQSYYGSRGFRGVLKV